jgi:tetraacyldisaccharide 4'-kinase
MQIEARLRTGDAVHLQTGERRPLARLAGEGELHAIAGIGHPDAFFGALAEAGLAVECHALPDHARFDADALGVPASATVLMTEKDAVKCAHDAPARAWWVDLEVDVDRDDRAQVLSMILERTGLTGAGVPLG